MHDAKFCPETPERSVTFVQAGFSFQRFSRHVRDGERVDGRCFAGGGINLLQMQQPVVFGQEVRAIVIGWSCDGMSTIFYAGVLTS